MRNIGSTNLSYYIDAKQLKNLGITITNNKVSKIQHSINNVVDIQLVYSTKRTMKAGPVCFIIPVIVDNGPRYILEISADIIGEFHICIFTSSNPDIN